MKKSDIERQLKKDLDDSAPSDFDALRKKCAISDFEDAKEPVPEFALATADGGSTGGGRKTVRAVAWLTAAVLFLSCVLIALLWGLSGRTGPILPVSDGYFLFDINPSVEVSYDKKGRVKSARGLNEDGEVLLYGAELAGKNYEEAAEILFDRCVKLGYFSASRENNAVLVSASLSEGGKDEKMTLEMKKLLSEEFSSNKIRGVVITGVDNPDLEREAAKYGIDAQKYALIQTYLALGGKLAEEEYKNIPVRDLYSFISEKQEELKEEEIAELETQTSEMEEELFEALAESVGEMIEELEDCIERLYEDSENEDDEKKQERYEKQIEELESYADEIEDAKNKGECQKLVDKLLKAISDMKAGETDELLIGLLGDVYARIGGLYQTLEEALKELKLLTASADEKNSARLDKFGNSGGGDEDFDYEKWQEEKEEEFAASWYDFKRVWNEEREHDLDD